MEKEKVAKIQSIAYWLTEIEKMRRFKENLAFNHKGDKNTVIRTRWIFEHKVPRGCGGGEIEIDNNMMSRFCSFLDEEEKHLEKNIAESDEDLVEIAKAYLDGKLGTIIERMK